MTQKILGGESQFFSNSDSPLCIYLKGQQHGRKKKKKPTDMYEIFFLNSRMPRAHLKYTNTLNQSSVYKDLFFLQNYPKVVITRNQNNIHVHDCDFLVFLRLVV